MNAQKILLDNGIRPHSAVYRENLYKRGAVEIKLYEEREKTDPEKIRRIISSALKTGFRDAEITVEDFFTALFITEDIIAEQYGKKIDYLDIILI